MKLFDIVNHNDGKVSGIRITLLWIISLTITHNNNKGKHLNIGFGMKPLEISLQFSIWYI
jgi:hypothetical protein|tara:strand:- start:456 stop:635 length:180 start_codon:yes stop_codon:yes gene_type:complete